MRRWIAALAGLGLAACGGAGTSGSTVPRPTEAAPSRSLVDVVPPETRSYTFVNLHAVRGTRLYETMDETISAWGETLDRLAEAAEEDDDETDGDADGGDASEGEDLPQAWDILGRVDWLFVASDPRDEERPAVSFLGAAMSDADARALVRIAAGERSDLPTPDLPLPFGMGARPVSDPLELGIEEEGPIEARPVRVYGRRGFEALEYRLVEARPGVWLLGTATDVGGVLERWDAPAPQREAGVARVHDRIGLFEHHLVFAVEDAQALREVFAPTPDEPEPLTEEQLEIQRALGIEPASPDEPPEIPEWLERVDAGALAVDVSHGLRARAVLQTSSRERARETERALRRALDEAIEEDRFVALFGLRRVVRRIAPARDEDRVWMEVELDELEAHGLWGRLSGTVSGMMVAIEGFTDTMNAVEERLGDMPTPDSPATLGVVEAELLRVESDAPLQTGLGVAGGMHQAEVFDASCRGWIGGFVHPVTVREEGVAARIVVRSRYAPTLALQLEDGSWRCADGPDPVLEGPFPVGVHRLFVGAPDPSGVPVGFEPAYAVGITRDPSVGPDALPRHYAPAAEGTRGAVYLDDTPRWSEQPGETDTPTQDASELAADCVGSIPLTTDWLLVHDGPGPWRLAARGDRPLTLVVRGPEGPFRCVSGSEVVIPLDAGPTEVWVGPGTRGAAPVRFSIGVGRDPSFGARDLPAP